MKHMWSPWRMEYIQGDKKQSGCVFCNTFSQADGPDNQVVFRGKNAFVMLNRYPYTSGHLMVVPVEHVSVIKSLSKETRSEIMELTNQAMQILDIIYRPDGFNLGMNIGKAAGAGIAEHIHFHIVPRWDGDTNFMSSVGEVRVLPEGLIDTYQRIANVWKKTTFE